MIPGMSKSQSPLKSDKGEFVSSRAVRTANTALKNTRTVVSGQVLSRDARTGMYVEQKKTGSDWRRIPERMIVEKSKVAVKK